MDNSPESSHRVKPYRRLNYSAEEEAAVVQEYKNGDPAHLIGSRRGVSKTAIKRILRRHGIDMRKDGMVAALGLEQKAEAIALYHAGEGTPDIGKRFGVTYSVIVRALKEAGIKIRSRGDYQRLHKLTPEQVKWIPEAYLDGRTAENIAEELNVTKPVVLYHLKRAGVNRRQNLIDLTNRIFGRWKVLGPAGRKKGIEGGETRHYWVCQCSCPLRTIKQIRGHALTCGSSMSCGCLHDEMVKTNCLTHGMSNSPEHNIWCGIKSRCNNPNATGYEDYGGKGITICERWNDFANFYADMGPRPGPNYSIDRKDNSKGYEPDNCCWATELEQKRNTTKTVFLTLNGETLALTTWAERIGIPAAVIHGRKMRGHTDEEALTFPYIPKPCRRVLGKEKQLWRNIIHRCHSENCPSFRRYGGRGIKVCQRFRQSFEAFMEDLGPRPTIAHSVDRIDNLRGYECGKCEDCKARAAMPNCRWATPQEQANNRNNSLLLTLGGITKPATEWAKELGITPAAIRMRKKKGMSDEEALTKPFRKSSQAKLT